jgi:flagellar biogenesis protein FliO
MSTQRASFRVPDLDKAAIVLAPQILPSIAGKKKSSTLDTTARVKKSTKAKTLRVKKAAQQSKSVPGRKVSEKRPAKAMSPARTKSAMNAPPAVVMNSLPQLVLSDNIALVEVEAGMMPHANADFTAAVSPILVVAEEEHPEPAALANEEIIADHRLPEDPNQVNEGHAFASENLGLESDSSPAEKQTFLQALALQCSSLFHILAQAWNWTQRKLKSHQVKKRLRVCESVSLGDKRFIAVIQVDSEQFLVGGSSSSVSTLAHLEPRKEFSEVFRSRCEQDLSQA